MPIFWRMPGEIFNLIIEMVDDYPISMEEGLQMRQEFRAERKAYRSRHTQAMKEYDQWDFYDESDGPNVDDE